ncbi:25578_t:CDS:2 [Gigaspora rosea]|nr:25578_t:CDS:2 [Gigaspora rosea]
MTIGQALQLSIQQKTLPQALKRKITTTKANHVEPKRNKKTVAMRCHIQIKRKSVVAILDSGAAVTKALGIIDNVKIALQDIAIPINLKDEKKETFMSKEAYLSDNSSTAFFDNFFEEELYENSWKDLIQEKNLLLT